MRTGRPSQPHADFVNETFDVRRSTFDDKPRGQLDAPWLNSRLVFQRLASNVQRPTSNVEHPRSGQSAAQGEVLGGHRRGALDIGTARRAFRVQRLRRDSIMTNATSVASPQGKPTPPTEVLKELTVRGVILGVLITLIFTAANVFFGLKAGLTFSTSIPAAVISMAVLRGFKGVTIQENNIVQTVASAAGTLSSIIFVLPGLVMIGWWTGFPYWTSVLICALGGILGVMYSIPLRRALVTDSDLPYPEGVACAEVLKVGGGGGADTDGVDETRAGLLAVLGGSIVSAVFAVVVATRIFAERSRSVFPRWHERGRDGLRSLLLHRVVRRGPPGRPVGRRRHRARSGRSPGSGASRTTRR